MNNLQRNSDFAVGLQARCKRRETEVSSNEYLKSQQTKATQDVSSHGISGPYVLFKRRPMHAQARVSKSVHVANDNKEANHTRPKPSYRPNAKPSPGPRCHGASAGALHHLFSSSLCAVLSSLNAIISAPAGASTSTGIWPGVCQWSIFVFSGASTSTALSSPWTSLTPT